MLLKIKLVLLVVWSSLFSCAQQQKDPSTTTALPNAIEEISSKNIVAAH